MVNLFLVSIKHLGNVLLCVSRKMEELANIAGIKACGLLFCT